jgi:hypothetical protein
MIQTKDNFSCSWPFLWGYNNSHDSSEGQFLSQLALCGHASPSNHKSFE